LFFVFCFFFFFFFFFSWQTRLVSAYLAETQDTEYLASILPTLDKEYAFWELFRSVTLTFNDGSNHRLNVYGVVSDVPRPESYVEDLELGSHFETDDKRADFYSQMASGAESGWDYSSRWFEDGVRPINSAGS